MTAAGTRILVGWDGSDRARDGLALARLLGAPLDATLVIACVHPYEPRSSRSGAGNSVELGRGDAIARLADPALVSYEHRILPSSSVARGLHYLAEDEGVELVVVGSTHRGALGRVVPGAVGERLLHGAPCAVAVAPVGLARRPSRLERVGVGIDGSPESHAALASATGLAAASGAAVRVLTVVEWASSGGETFLGAHPVYGDAVEELRAARREAHERALAAVPAEVQADGRLLDGEDPVRALCAAAEGLDLLVLGSRGYGPLGHVLLGGVSTGVLGGAPCAVLVTARGVEQPFGAPRPAGLFDALE